MSTVFDKVCDMAPGIRDFIHYPKEAFSRDLSAGLSVAAVALPVSIAYAQLAGFSPLVGLASTILPMIIYSLFGSSKQLIVGPDAATCTMIAAILLPLAHGNAELYLSLTIALTFFAGLFCLLGNWFKLGFLADFLSRPILTGLLNGVAVTIIFKQVDKVTGIETSGRNVISAFMTALDHSEAIHWPTFFFSLGLLVLYIGISYRFKKLPIALIVMLIAMALTSFLQLPTIYGIEVIGSLEKNIPNIGGMHVPLDTLGSLVTGGAMVALMSYSSGMLTARSFAAKNGYPIDGNREFLALGLADFGAALSGGFAISGADSRTAVNDAAGGKTRLVSIIGAVAVLVVLLFFTEPLAWIPSAALGVILIASAYNLIDCNGLFRLYAVNSQEFWISIITFGSVLFIGVLPGILIAIAISLIRFLTQVARPHDEQLGFIPDEEGFYELSDYSKARPTEGLIIYRFDSPIIFFNADYFRERLTKLIDTSPNPVQWVIVDAIAIGNIDVTGLSMLIELGHTLQRRGIKVAIVGRTRRAMKLFEKWAPRESLPFDFFPTRRGAYAAFKKAQESKREKRDKKEQSSKKESPLCLLDE